MTREKDVEQRITIVRSDHIGTLPWNTENTNAWTTASLMTILNEGEYYQRIGEYSQIGLRENAKSMIETVTWNLGGYLNTSIEKNLISDWYNLERGNKVYNGNQDTWNGNVALMYLSDYGYATTGRSNCLNIALYNWGINEDADCKSNDWLYDPEFDQWALEHNNVANYYAEMVMNNGGIRGLTAESQYYVNNSFVVVRPTLYLKQNVKIISGTGSRADAFEIAQVIK